jgi:DNA-binding NarL/FixJ family response regulator
MLDGLRLILESEYDIVATVTDGANLLAEAEKLRPDLVLTDVSLPTISGIEVASRLRYVLPGTKIVFVTADSNLESVLSGLRTEGAGYVLKQCSGMELRSAIKEVLRGGVYITPLVKKQAAQHLEASARSFQTPGGLTGREKAVLQLVAEGLSARDIGAILNISVKTVAFHKTNIKQKLEVRTTAALTKYALQHGVIS